MKTALIAVAVVGGGYLLYRASRSGALSALSPDGGAKDTAPGNTPSPSWGSKGTWVGPLGISGAIPSWWPW